MIVFDESAEHQGMLQCSYRAQGVVYGVSAIADVCVSAVCCVGGKCHAGQGRPSNYGGKKAGRSRQDICMSTIIVAFSCASQP